MTRVYLRPDVATIEANNGIGRVVHAQAKYLPRFDVELVGSADKADVVAGHTHDHGAPRIDVAHLHGLYWTGDPGSGRYTPWHAEANTRIIASVRRARAVTVPSHWVAEPFRRDMRIQPTVIGHGIEPAEWAPSANGGYVLWNKNRDGDVCDPIWPWHLSRAGVQVVSTFAPSDREPASGMRVTGPLGSGDMREIVRSADVYLATTKETFGIGTLEAMASGVPVLGFDWGGTSGLVTHREDGWLAAPGDLHGLLEGLAYIRAHRAQMGANARATASRYSWEAVIGQYAALYHQLAGVPDPTGVAVVITCHNYGSYVAACIESVLAQTYAVDEIIVVDDGSTDDSREIAIRYGPRVRLIAQPNTGVAAARNVGVLATSQPFVICLDADDMLDPRYVATCRDAMLRDRGLGLTWTGMAILRGDQTSTSNWGSGTFDWEWQAGAGVPPHTNVPTGAMFRRSMFDRAGGYKQEHAPGEDAEFYTRGLSVGFTAQAAASLPWFIYRDHGHGAHRSLPYKPIDTWHPWMRDRAYPLGAPALTVPDVRSYSAPKVSVIIPVGPGHARYLPDALESLIGQNMRDWEVIVVADGDPLDLERYPFARVVATGFHDALAGSNWTPPAGPGAARNAGLALARAPLCLFLDADDQLAPGALAALCRAFADAGGRYVYGDWQAMGESHVVREAEYRADAWLDFDDLSGKHAVTVLMATADAQRLKFDEQLGAWEDWDFFTRAAIAGVQGQHVDAVTLYVRRNSNGRTARAFHSPNGVIGKLRERYGGAHMAGCCGGNGAATLAAKQAYAGVPSEQTGGLTLNITNRGSQPVPTFDPNVVAPVRMEFVGKRSGAVTYNGARGSGRQYRGGNNPVNRFHNVHPADVAVLENGGEWRRVAPVLVEVAHVAPVKPDLVGPDLEAETAQRPASASSEWTPEDGTATMTRAARAAQVAAPVVEATATEMVAVIQTADGPVQRRVGRRAPKNTPLKDLPPLEP